MWHDTAIPHGHPHTYHHDNPYSFGNSPAGRREAKRLGYRYIDNDFQCTSDGMIVNGHGHLPRMDGFTHVQRGLRRVRDPHPSRPISQRTWAEVKTLRQAKGRAKYSTARDVLRHCHRLGLILCMEVKGSRGFTDAGNYTSLRSLAVSLHATVYVMTLQDIDGWALRLAAAKAAGFQTALLPRGHKPVNWRTASTHVDAVWGAWR